MRLTGVIRSADVKITLLKSGAHRLSEPDELDLIQRDLGAMLDRLRRSGR